jgi:hypothetical protein
MGDCIFLPTKQRNSHEFRELRENIEETTYFAKEATARNNRTRKQPKRTPFLCCFRAICCFLVVCLSSVVVLA